MATLLEMRRRTPDADFCPCDPGLGEHLCTIVESDDGNARICFYPDTDAITVIRVETL